MKNLSPINENKDVVTKEYVDPVKSQAALNRTTLGTQCKNLLKLSHPFGYKYTNAAGTATWTFNNDYSVSMVVNSKISSGVAISISEVTLKKGTYLYSVEGYSTPNITHTQLYSLNADGSWTWLANLSAIENKITVTEETTYSFRAYRNSSVTVGVTETLYPMLRSADITDDTYEPYQPSLIDRCLLKDTAGIALGAAQSSSITIDNLSSYTALWVNVSGGVSGINFTTNLIVPIAYLAKSTSNSVQLAGGIPSSAYITSEGVLAVKHMDGTITAKVNGNTLDLTIGEGTIGAIEVVSLM